MFIRALSAATALLASSTAQSVDAPIQPTGKWIVHFDDAQCLAERDYGSQQRPLYLALKQPALGDVIQLDFIESGYAGTPTQLDAQVQLDGLGPLKTTVLRYKPPKESFRIHMMNLPLKQFETARTAKNLSIKVTGFDQQFALDRLGPLLDVMEQCVADLRNVWNVKSSGEEKGRVRDDAKGNLRRLFSADDYPMESLMNGDSGVVLVALLVNEKGRVADCSIVQTSGVAMLDAQSCAILKERAKFVPAVGRDGKPAKDAFIQRINWKVSY